MLLVYPGASSVPEPRHVRYGAEMVLRLGDGTVAQDTGQLVITGERLIGMMFRGTAGGVRLDAASGSVYAFAVGLDDIQPAEPGRKRRGRPTGALIRSRDGGNPAFGLEILAVVGTLGDDGRLTFGYGRRTVAGPLSGLLDWLTPAGREQLRELPAG